MIKYILIGIVVLAAIGIAGFSLFANQTPSDKKTSSDSAKTTTVQKESMEEGMIQSETLTGTIFDLLARGTSLECTFITNNEYGSTSGTVYIAGDSVRGDFELISLENSTDSYEGSMIRGDEYTYIWSSNEDTGMMMANVDPEEVAAELEENETLDEEEFSLEDLDAEYDCKKWNVDQSMFEPPTDIEFVDFSVQMEQMEEVFEGQASVDCSICDELPEGDIQTQCRSSLGC